MWRSAGCQREGVPQLEVLNDKRLDPRRIAALFGFGPPTGELLGYHINCDTHLVSPLSGSHHRARD